MKCYLINLDRSLDRLKFMQNEFERCNVKFTRVAAVDGRLLSQQDKDAVTGPMQRVDMPISPSEIGCFLSHRKCLEMVADGEDRYAAIFEDDINLSRDTDKFLNNDHWIPEYADIVKIETHDMVIQVEDLMAVAGTSRNIGRLISKHLCTGGYIVSKDAATHILGLMDKIFLPVDYLIFDPSCELSSQLKIYQITPALCKQAGLDSLIEEDRQSYRPKVQERTYSYGALTLRKFMRPYRRSSYLFSLKKIWLRLTTNKRWLRVPFRS